MGCPPKLASSDVRPTSWAIPKTFPTIPGNIIHAYHVGFHVDFSSTKYFMGCGPKLPSYKVEVEALESLNQLVFKDFQEPWPNGVHVSMSLDVHPLLVGYETQN